MSRRTFASRVVVLVFVVFAAIVSSSCDSATGVGAGVSTPARWGGTSGPPVMVGGPSFR